MLLHKLISGVGLIIACLASFGCNPDGESTQSNGQQTSLATNTLVDSDASREVPLVLRVKVVENHGGSKYHWVTVEILAVLKNTTDEQFGRKMDVATLGLGQGIPEGQCTIYLTRYNDANHETGWKLHETDESKIAYTHHVAEKQDNNVMHAKPVLRVF